MEGKRKRRCRSLFVRLYPERPQDLAILEWLDRLPSRRRAGIVRSALYTLAASLGSGSFAQDRPAPSPPGPEPARDQAEERLLKLGR
jgi:hypothetical protein